MTIAYCSVWFDLDVGSGDLAANAVEDMASVNKGVRKTL
ncbi:hypothetical protein JCM19240_2389 [Vibrio maritimus]|uniref:Uncharacterized protein n=1 Tax=Vibrio maritimus TaxID=990268 RepID=A0A090T3D0_9VIBR|nr:hypothetical protein JCM19240_2389 [Vibrio maritimus]